jgi:hypothetical protein
MRSLSKAVEEVLTSSKGFVFDIVSQSVLMEHEAETLSPDLHMYDQFRSVMNEGGTSDQRPPRILFPKNEALREHCETAALHDLIAAYLYVREKRLALGENIDEEFRKHYLRIEDTLRETLEEYRNKDPLMERILAQLKNHTN